MQQAQQKNPEESPAIAGEADFSDIRGPQMNDANLGGQNIDAPPQNIDGQPPQ